MQKELNYEEDQQLLFNIVVPVFNAEKYIKNCLYSIINQSYKNFQVKVVDDCSTDSSYEVAAGICSNFKNFEIFKNSKRIGALNNIYEMLNLKIKEPTLTIDIMEMF